jgi:transposase InsO family protein
VLLPPVEPSQFTSWAFAKRIKDAGLIPSFGSVGDGLDNAIDESRSPHACTSSYSTAREKKTRIELANAITRIHRDLPQPTKTTLRSGTSRANRIRVSLAKVHPSQPDLHIEGVTKP